MCPVLLVAAIGRHAMSAHVVQSAARYEAGGKEKELLSDTARAMRSEGEGVCVPRLRDHVDMR